jgi:hypothetical protein
MELHRLAVSLGQAIGEAGQFSAGFVCSKLSHNGCTAVSGAGIILCPLKVTPDHTTVSRYLFLAPSLGQASELA